MRTPNSIREQGPADRELTIAIGQAMLDRNDTRIGVVDRVVCDPTLARLTHVIVRPDLVAASKLVPVEGLEVVDGDLRLPPDQLWPESFLDAETVRLLSVDERLAAEADPVWPVNGALVWPHLDVPTGTRTVVHEHLPLGEVSIGVGAEVVARDGAIGKVAGFVVHPDEQRATHIVLRHGHLWGKRTMLIPIELASASSDGDVVHLEAARDDLSRYQVP